MKTRDPLRAKLNVVLVALLAFGFGLGLASALDLTPFSVAAGGPETAVPKLELGPRAMSGEADVSGGFADIVANIEPAVVTIYVEQQVSARQRRPRIPLPAPFDDFFNQPDEDNAPRFQRGSGSGFIITSDGYILTNNHVVENATRVDVELADQQRFDDVHVVGSDPQTDVALLKLQGDGFPTAPLGSSDSTRVGDWVLAIGSPGFTGVGGGTLPSTVTAGIVSAKGRNIGILGSRFLARGRPNLSIEDFIQTDAVINPGNSGGPLVNARGEVIGMNTAIASTTGVYQGYGFAVPVELARDVVNDLIQYGEVRRAVIGVSVQPVSAADAQYYHLDKVAGAKIADFTSTNGSESPAAKAGLKPGDLIVGVAGKPISSVSDLQRRIRTHHPGETVTLDVVRRSTRKRTQVKVKLIAAETKSSSEEPRTASAESRDPLGIEVAPLTDDLRESLEVPDNTNGVVIRRVAPRGPMGRAAGDLRRWLIQDVNGQEVDSPADYRKVIRDLKPGDVANLLLYNPQSQQHVVISVQVPQTQ
ncbi:MAG: trypsin-like peptidase domain-containing protein [Gemmatimonadota bacterium]